MANNTIDAAMHFMYPLAHLGKIPEKYKNDLKRESINKDFWNIIEDGWGKKFIKEIKFHFMQSDWHSVERTFYRKKSYLTLRSVKQIRFQETKSFFSFINTNFLRLFRPNGLFIAFIGPDGCGKTTVQNNLQPFFEKGFTKDKIKKFYWRPFLLPRIKVLLLGKRHEQSKSDESEPSECLELREVGLGKRLVHCIKLLYYWIDYLIGRIKYQGAWSRGGVVCFDRYWDDLLVYPERFGLNVPTWLLKVLGLFIPQPDIIFYLDADAKVLDARKPELPKAELSRQIEKYRDLAKKNKRIFYVNAEYSEQDVQSLVIRICLEKMSQRYL